jgi:LPXTG-motif cell wall-anchored protein
LFSSWKTILALLGAFALGMALTALLLRRRRRSPSPVSTPTPVVYENQA